MSYEQFREQIKERFLLKNIWQKEQDWSGELLARNAQTNQTHSKQKVAAIEVKYVGPTSVKETEKETEVRQRIRTQVGQAYTPAHVDDDVRSLYSTGRFYNIRVSAQSSSKGVELVYSVQCNPRLAKVAFTGNSKFSSAQLQKLIRAKVGDVFNERNIFVDSQAIQTAYESAGYKGTGVKYSYETDEQAGEASITFRITEKPS
jgi:outer membrane protein insertion porin family